MKKMRMTTELAIEKFKAMGILKRYYEYSDYEIRKDGLTYWLCFSIEGEAIVHVLSEGRTLEETITPVKAMKRLFN